MSVRLPAAPRQTIYGQCRVSGSVVYESCLGNQHHLNQIIAWASHPCYSIDSIYLDGRQSDVPLPSVGTPQAGGQDSGGSRTDDCGNSYNFGDNLWIYSTIGSPEGYWFPQLSGSLGSDYHWDNTCTLNNICASYVNCGYNSGVYSGPPGVKATIHGKYDIYDPRTETYGWTQNAALIIADVLCNKDYGLGCDYATEIDEAQLIAAANLCDEQVTIAATYQSPQTWRSGYAYQLGNTIIDSNGYLQTCIGQSGADVPPTSGGSHPTWNDATSAITYDHEINWQCDGYAGVSPPTTESRYTINGFFDWSRTPGDILDGMLMSCEGRLTYSGGVWKIFPAAWYGTGLEFDESMLTGSIKWSPKRKYRDLVNAVRGTFISPVYPYAVVGFNQDQKDPNIFSGEWQPADFPEYAQDALHGYASDTNLAQDGGYKLHVDRRYPYVTSVSTVQRLAKIFLMRNRQQGTGTLTMNLAAYQAQPSDVFQMTSAIMGWDHKNLEVQSLRFIPSIPEDEKTGPSLSVEMDVCESDPSVYSWSAVEEMGVEDTISPVALDSLQVDAPTGLTLTSGYSTAVIGVDGVLTPRILATWTEPDDPFITTGGSIIVQMQQVGGAWSTVATVSGTTVQLYIPGVVCGQQYNVSVVAVRSNGAYSATEVVGPLTVSTTYSTINSNGILSNIPRNTTNNLTLDSVTATTSVTVRLYGPGGVGTSGTVYQGSDIEYSPIGPCTWTGMLPNTGYYCYYNPQTTLFYLVTNATTAVDDFYIPIGSLLTCNLAGTGGVIGGGTGGGIGATMPCYASVSGDSGGTDGGGDAPSGGDAGGSGGGGGE
jgi:hypothetical protein